MDKGVNRKDDSTRLLTLAPETMTVGPECPRESQEEEGADATIRGRNGQEPSKPIPENSAFGPLRTHETEEKDDGTEEVEGQTRKRPDWGLNRVTVRFWWGMIRSRFVGPRPESA